MPLWDTTEDENSTDLCVNPSPFGRGEGVRGRWAGQATPNGTLGCGYAV